VASSLDRHRERFEADSGDSVAFAALEEHHFLRGEWHELVGLYWRRLTAPALRDQKRERARLLFRLGQVLEERCLEPDHALACYREAVRLEPTFRPALRQLRRLHESRSEWVLSLQIADLEAEIPMPPYEAAPFHAEIGMVWLRQLSDAPHALQHFQKALELDSRNREAIEGSARAFEALGRTQEAADAWDRLAHELRGAERAPALVARARLLERDPAQAERAEECYQRALADDPRNEEAVEALCRATRARGHWAQVVALAERRFDLAAGASRRVAVALDAGRIALEQLSDVATARLWLSRAAELAPEDVEVHAALAAVERHTGDPRALFMRLERLAQLAGDATPSDVWVEAASLAAELGDTEAALARLRRGLERGIRSPELFAKLSDVLLAAGRHEELVDVLERRAALASGEPAIQAALWMRLGALHLEKLADVDAAREVYERAFQVAPETPGLIEALEQIYRKGEAFGQLRTLLESSVAAAEGVQRLRPLCALGDLLLDHFGEKEAASQAFEQALALDPRAERALRGLERVAILGQDPAAIVRAYEREAAVAADRERLTYLVGELVRRHEESGHIEAALGWATRLADLAPSAAALETCVRLHEASGNDTELCRVLQKLDPLVSSARQAELRRRLATLNAACGREREAAAAWERALEIEPDHAPSLVALATLHEAAGRLGEAAKLRRQLVDLVPAARASSLRALAKLLDEGLGDHDGAIDALSMLAREGLSDAAGDARLEELLEHTGRFEVLALRLQERHEQLARNEAPVAAELAALDLRRAALLQDQLGRTEEAISVLRGVVSADPTCDAAIARLEHGLRDLDDADGLAALLGERAARARNDEERAPLWLEQALLLSERLDRSGEAKLLLRNVAEQRALPALAAQAEDRLERLLGRRGEWDELRATLEHRLAALGGPADAHERFTLHERLARICRDRARDRDGAIRHFEGAAALEPERPELWQSLALLYTDTNQPQDLLRALEGEIETGPEPVRELALRARAAQLCADALGDEARAEAHWQRALELSPGHTEAAEFLIGRLSREGRHRELVSVLERRLAALDATAPGERAQEALRRASLRQRIAELRASTLDDPAGAIEALEPALDELGPVGAIAEPLAALYVQTGQTAALVDLCATAGEAAQDPAQRANWHLRLGDALRALGRDEAAREAYRKVLSDRPEDLGAKLALRELYRQSGEAQPLAQLLESELARVAGPDETPVRLELSALFAGPLARQADALVHLRRVLELEPSHGPALEQVLSLAVSLGRPAEALAPLERAIRGTRSAARRATLLVRKADLLAGALEQPGEAAAAYREALALDASQRAARRGLAQNLAAIGDWQGHVEALLAEAQGADAGTREALLVEAARVAEERLAPAAALPWLERLRAVRAGDRQVLARITTLRRRVGEPTGLLRALEAQAAATSDPDALHALHVERAAILERDLAAPARAAAALEQALAVRAGDPETLRELERLYAALRRTLEQAAVIERSLATASGPERLALRRRLAGLLAGAGGQPDRAAEQLREALAESEATGAARLELVQALGDVLAVSGRRDEWAAAAEEELRLLDRDAPVFAERRRTLHADLARAYVEHLGNPEAALPHLRVLVGESRPGGGSAGALDPERVEAEERLITLLRAEHADVELADRLARRLTRAGDDVEGWLELARLRHERLYAYSGAAAAYREVLTRAPGHAGALRGLRAASELLGDFETVASTLEQELAQPGTMDRAALLRRLGEVAWRHLGSTTRASRAFAGALEVEPQDRVSLHSLETLLEAMEDWRGALDLYESEVELLGQADSARRAQIWLRVAEISRRHTQDGARAIGALEAAAQIGPLRHAERLTLAELYREAGKLARFVEVFTTICDDREVPAQATDHLALAEALEALGQRAQARARIEQAFALDSQHLAVCDATARLREASGDAAGAARALAQASELAPDGAAAERLVRAAALVEPRDLESAGAFARRAAERDPASAKAQAILARVGAAQGRHEEAASAAARALDLAAQHGDLAPAERLEVALAGGASARSAGPLEDAVRLFAAALAIDPAHERALGEQGEVLFELNDFIGARRHLEAWLALPGRDDALRARRLALLGRALDGEDEPVAALARYSEAIALDGSRQDAREGLVSLHERAGRKVEAMAALEAWASVATPAVCASCLTRAAELGLEETGLPARVEAQLREALSADRRAERAWIVLATRLSALGRADEALATASEGLEHVREGLGRAALLRVRGRALEARGSRRDAAAAYREAAQCDAGDLDGALAAARLLRALGEWRQAGEMLASFAAHFQGADRSGLGEVLLQLGRLRAGPLEDVDGAIEAYERALAVQPQQREAREALAELLTFRPARWEEARSRHRELLDAQPTRLASLRGLIRIAEGGLARGRAPLENGLAILRALGAASPTEREAAPATLSLRIGQGGSLGNVVWERARHLVREVAQEIGQALGSPAPASTAAPGAADPAASFRQAALEAEAALAAPALVPLPADEAGAVVALVARLAHEREQLSGDGRLINAVSDALGRWARRRVRKAMGSSSPEEIAEIDFVAWRGELRALAHAAALDACGGNLRAALCALLQDAGQLALPPPDEVDLTPLVDGTPEARELLRRVAVAWSETV